MENEGEKIDWASMNKEKYYVFFNGIKNKFEFTYCQSYKFGCIYFYSKEIAEKAITEIIEPFMKKCSLSSRQRAFGL